ncbi:hypothetical protein SI65_09712 [Aspergillus cristatus]|uniref:Uncharacterized protein n=1 Tax=Aspergillus cristatus TaxID=573508 RepID=A0A1E3B1X5_ASPCR|nr:hypothetical protein SI65_09712 [Aspergillus cristatus]
MERRDRQFEKEEQREHYQVPQREESDQQADMAKMSHALQSRENPSTNQKSRKKMTSQQAVQIDIAAIGAAPFQ